MPGRHPRAIVCAALAWSAFTLAGCGNVTINVAYDDNSDSQALPNDTSDAGAVDAVDSGATGNDGGVADTAIAEDTAVADDTAVEDTSVTDTGNADTAVEDTAVEDTAVEDTAVEDTAVEDTAVEDAGPTDTGSADTAVEDTGSADSGSADTGTTDTGPSCDAKAEELCNGVDDDCDGKTDEGTCDDGIACTTDICGGTTGCVHQSSGAPCDDGDVCTTGDSCTIDGCKPDGATNCDDGNACTTDACDADTGCSHVDNSLPCDDGKACTTADACSNGACSGAIVGCDDGNACTTDTCGDTSGCKYIANTLLCDDGDPCTTGEVCAKGSCSGGKTTSCDDGEACTIDACKAGKGCTHAAAADGTACPDGSCKTGICNVSLVCKAGMLKGNLAIGPKSSYTTFGQALAALAANGVCGPTTFTVAGGTYTEVGGFVFKPIPGAGAGAPVRFEAAAGQIVRLVGASAGTYSAIVRIDAKTSWLTLGGFDLDGKEPANKIGGNYGGPVVFATAGAQSHVRIEGFRIHDFLQTAWASTSYIGGVYMQLSNPTDTIEFVGNRFENLDPGSSAATQGGICTRNGQNANMHIVGNTFVGIGHMAAIRFRNGGNWQGLVVANNNFIVSDTETALSWYGTNVLSDNALFAHNSVLLGKSATAMEGKVSFGFVDVRNNIIYAPTGGTFVSSTQIGSYGKNCVNGVNAATGGTVVGPDVVATPNFVLATAPYDLHVQTGSACLNKGDLLPAVPLDIDGEKRNNPSDLGADERL